MRRSPRPRVYQLPLFGFLWAAACAYVSAGPAQPPRVAGEPIAAWLVDIPDRGGHQIYLRNDSDRVQRVTGVTLRDCNNIREECSTHRLDVLLCPGEGRRVFTVRPRASSRGERFSFNWSYQARAYEPDEPIVGGDCEGMEG